MGHQELTPMPQTVKPKKTTRKQSMRQILKKAPRMPAAQNRRLNRLIDKSKAGELSAGEEKELRGLLETVDRQSFLMVANGLMKYIAQHGQLPNERGPRRRK
jgi:hypothetical protein